MKINNILFSVLLVFVVAQSTQATSGACSYHGGVNCSAGPDYDGSVICNDGWSDSSVGYYETSSCSSSNIPLCVYPSAYGCTTESSYSSMRAIWAASRFPDTMIANLQECRNQIDEYNRLKAEYDQCFYNLTHPTPYPTPVATPRPTPTPTPFVNDWNYQNEQFDIEYGQTVYPLVVKDFPDFSPSEVTNIRNRVHYLAFNRKDLLIFSLKDIYQLFVKSEFAVTPTLTPSPIAPIYPTSTPLFKDLFKNSNNKPSVTPKPLVTPLPRFNSQTPIPTTTLSPSVTARPEIDNLKRENNILKKISKLIWKLKFW